jgi:hypothetical protein
VIARNAERLASLHHAGDEMKYLHGARAAIHQVANEDQLAVARGRHRIHSIGLIHDVAELRHQLDELVEASMNISDDVEWAVLGLLVIPKGVALNRYGVHFLRAGEFEDVADAFSLQPAQGTAELLGLIANDVRPELPVRTKYVAILTHSLREVEDNRLCEEMKLLCQRDQRLPCLWLDVSCVDYRQTATSEPLAHDFVQQVEGIADSRLVVLVIGYERTAEVRGDDFCRQEVLSAKR